MVAPAGVNGIERLEALLSPRQYLRLLEDLAMGRIEAPEIDEVLSESGYSRERLARVLTSIGRIMIERRRPVVYPVEMIVVPRYPFTKVPMIRWSELKSRDHGDPLVNRIKDLSTRLGTLINAGFLLRHMVLVDIDGKPEAVKSMVDVETRRGYHKLFVIRRYPALGFKLGNNAGTKIVMVCGGTRVEVLSGSNFLGSHPMQSRWLEWDGKRFNVRRYRFVSRDAEIAFGSADLTPLEATVDDVREYLARLADELGCPGYARQLEIRPLEKEELAEGLPDPKPRQSRFNANPVMVVAALGYGELKRILEPKRQILPTCLRQALYGEIEKGHRWFHLRLLLAVLPFIARLEGESFEEMIRDFAERTRSSRGDLRKWVYDARYFTGRATVDGEERVTPSVYGVPAEAWSDFEALGYCRECPLRDTCLRLKPSERRRLIVDYVSKIVEREVGGER